MALPSHILLIFLKEPIAGNVKTRLGATVGDEEAARIYHSLVSTLLTQLKWIKNCHYRFCYAPEDASDAILHWILPQLEHKLTPEGHIQPLHPDLPTVDFTPQREGTLGDRLESAFQTAFQDGFQEVSVIGTDCPFLSARWIETALLAGKNHAVTLGPTYDGGYYFLSLKHFTPAPFRDIPWSTEKTCDVTREKLHNADLSYYLLPQLDDIDHEEDWAAALTTPLGAKLKKNLPPSY